jgi:hypothetical protein
MSHHTPQRTIKGTCPSCGPSRINVVLESSSYFSGITTPNWSCATWIGQCCKCQSYLESDVDDEQEIETLEWTPIDEEKVEFLFGGSSTTKTHPQTDPLWDSELDD